MKTFLIIWFGQLVSLFGTSMTRFALLIWAYQQTGDATTLALLGFFSFILWVAFSPVAGVVVDRVDRRLILIISDMGSGLMTLIMLLLFATDQLQIWHLYVAEALTGGFEAFQRPAYTAATTLLVPKKHFARASGMRTLALDASRVFAPVLGGLLLTVVDIDGVMLVDVATFIVAMLSLLVVRIPRPAVTAEAIAARGNGWQQLRFGFGYIMQRPGLRGLLMQFMAVQLFANLTYFGVLPAMILARTGGDELALGTVQGVLGIGGVIGGLLLSVWGGPRRKIHAIFGATALSFLLGDLLFALGRSIPVWIIASLSAAVFIPFIVGANWAIWQAKVPPDVQGRVFSTRATLEGMCIALGYLLAGPLADRLFEPALQPGGALVPVFGWLVGTGPGAGMAAMFLFTAFGGMIVSLSGYLIPRLRNVETDVPDFDLVLEPGAAD